MALVQESERIGETGSSPSGRPHPGTEEDVLGALARKGIDLCRNGKLEAGLPYLTFVRGVPGSRAELPSVFYSWLGYGMACLEGGRYVEGLELCQRAVGTGPSEVDNYLNLARAYLLLDRQKSAIDAIDAGLAELPENAALREVRREVVSGMARPGFSLGRFVFGAKRVEAAEAHRRQLAMELWTERQEQHVLRTQDSLTGLLDRHAFFRVARPALDFSAYGAQGAALLFVGLGDLRAVNETAGVSQGDAVLRAVARCVSDVAGARGMAARVGGDMFALVLHDVEDEAEVARQANDLALRISSEKVAGDDSGAVRASIGIAVCPRDARDPSTLLVRAESAMRRAKETGGNRCRFFSQPTPTGASESISMESRLKPGSESPARLGL